MGRRVVGIADSDSFVKWGASLLDTLPDDWEVALVVVASALTASPRQVGDALAQTRFGPVGARFLTITALLADAEVGGADAVLVACRGPVAEVVLQALARRGPRRPVLVSGLPGISIPAKWKGIFYRAQSDLFVLHSRREVRAYRDLAREKDTDVEFALATLPFARPARRASASDRPRDTIVFAAQAIVPRERHERIWLVGRLCQLARAHPDMRVVIKVRALPGEEQTHYEEEPLPDLLPRNAPPNLLVEAGPMNDHLERAVGFASVSSTAVLEAAARGVPSILLDDFGVSPLLMNEVFVGSGLLASSDDLLSLRFPSLDPSWVADNYAHPDADNTFHQLLDGLMRERDGGGLPTRRPARRSQGGALRRAWDRRHALGSSDRSVLGFVALVIGWPMFVLRRRRRIRLADRAAQAGPGSGDPRTVPALLVRAGGGDHLGVDVRRIVALRVSPDGDGVQLEHHVLGDAPLARADGRGGVEEGRGDVG